jgi:ubiquinone/menaquinone biosynthesis C-methylase UbiE
MRGNYNFGSLSHHQLLLEVNMSTGVQSPPNPAFIFDTLNSYQRTLALRSAIELDLFTAIGEGNTRLGAIARRVQASEKGMRVLCDFLTIVGLLTKSNDAAYGLAPDAELFLDRRSPAYLGTAVDFLGRIAEEQDGFKNLTGAVRKGGTVMPASGTMRPEHPIWVSFARSMAPMMAIPSELIAQMLAREGASSNVLDIAAGHGLFGIAVASHNPEARVTAVDWAPVLEVARENAAAAGVLDRYQTIAGSAFDVELGGGYDTVLLTNFLHHFDAATCETLLRRVRAAMRPGGRVLTLEFVPDPDRVSPPLHASFSLVMLATTDGGDAYTFAELDRMFRNAGFARCELRELEPTPNRVVLSYV